MIRIGGRRPGSETTAVVSRSSLGVTWPSYGSEPRRVIVPRIREIVDRPSVWGSKSIATPIWQDDDGTLWGAHVTGRVPRLYRSNGDLYNWEQVHSFGFDPTRVVKFVRRFSSGSLFVVTDLGGSPSWSTEIYRSDDDFATPPTKVLDQFDPSEYLFNATQWTESQNALFIAPYQTNDNLVETHVWRSTDNGDSWEKALTLQTKGSPNHEIRHIHAIKVDPFNPTHVYVCTGDGNGESRLYRSTDEGENWEVIGTGSQNWRIVGIGFTENYIHWVRDESPYHIYRLKRDNLPDGVDPDDDFLEYLGTVKGWAFHIEEFDERGLIAYTTANEVLTCSDEYRWVKLNDAWPVSTTRIRHSNLLRGHAFFRSGGLGLVHVEFERTVVSIEGPDVMDASGRKIGNIPMFDVP